MSILLEQLQAYTQEDVLRFHMPGHYGKILPQYRSLMENLFAYDITELPGMDNLAEPTQVLSQSMKVIAEKYRAQKSYFLVNGSTSGVHIAIDSLVENGGHLLVARNVHKSVINIARKKALQLHFVYPQIDEKFGVDSHIELSSIRRVVESLRRVDAVVLTYPNYYGRGYDIESIYRYLQSKGIRLIVDSAHGASFEFCSQLPVSAVPYADICIHSLHKTLPAFTQVSMLHIHDLPPSLVQKVEDNMRCYLSTSPSYLMMASAEISVDIMDTDGRKLLPCLYEMSKNAARQLEAHPLIDVYQSDLPQDFGKLLVQTPIPAEELSLVLREKYKIQCEMTIAKALLFMFGIVHTEKEIQYLVDSLIQAVDDWVTENPAMDGMHHDAHQGTRSKVCDPHSPNQDGFGCQNYFPKLDRADSETVIKLEGANGRMIAVSQSDGQLLAQDIIPYPPGIPVAMKFEYVNRQLIDLLERIGIKEIMCFSAEEQDI